MNFNMNETACGPLRPNKFKTVASKRRHLYEKHRYLVNLSRNVSSE